MIVPSTPPLRYHDTPWGEDGSCLMVPTIHRGGNNIHVNLGVVSALISV